MTQFQRFSQEVLKYKILISKIEKPFLGLPYAHISLINFLISIADPSTGIASGVSYHDIGSHLTVKPAPGRKDSGTPSKQTLRNYISSIERECGEYFKVITEGQSLKFLFPQLPKLFRSFFESSEVNTFVNTSKPLETTEEKRGIAAINNTDLNIEVNTTNDVKKLFILNNKHNKQTQTTKNYISSIKKPISDDFYPTPKAIEIALSMGLTKVQDLAEIQAFIKHNKKNQTQWADFNPVFITWLERGVRFNPKQQTVQEQTRSYHNERSTNQSTLNQTALERVSQYHGISIDSLWGNSCDAIVSGEFIDGTLIQSVDEANCNLWSALYK